MPGHSADPRGPQMRASKRTSAMLESDEEEDVDIGSPDAPEPDEQPPAKRQATQAAVEAPRFQKVSPYPSLSGRKPVMQAWLFAGPDLD